MIPSEVGLLVRRGIHTVFVCVQLAHPIIESLVGTEAEWLHHLLHAFNKGDIPKYEQLVGQYEQQLASQPILIQHVARMKEKISILCLIELIFARHALERSVPLSVIATATKVSLDRVCSTPTLAYREIL